jgi:spore germination cell wall hydrolase CwlJ-like protein
MEKTSIANGMQPTEAFSADIWPPAMPIRMEHDGASYEGMAPVGVTVIWRQ